MAIYDERAGAAASRRRRTGPAFVICAALLSSLALLSAQSQTSFRTRVDVVQLDVSVVDRDRRPVTGLTAADFTVLEGGSRRPIVEFTAVEAAASPVSPGDAAVPLGAVSPDVVVNDLPEGRLVAIVLDHAIRRGEPRVQALRVASRIIDSLGPGDVAAVVHTQFGRSQNLTRDRERLKSAAASTAAGTELENNNDSTAGVCYCGLCRVEAISRAAEALRDEHQRRKSVFYIGESFPAYPTGGACDRDIKTATERMVRATHAANVTVHAIDPNGIEVSSVGASVNLRPEGASAAARVIERQNRERFIESHQSLQFLASLTGGRTIVDTNAPEEHVHAILNESSSYYRLAFQAADPKPDGRFHPVSVKVNRPSVQVQTRNGYYATSPSSSAASGTELTPELLARDVFPRRDLRLIATAVPFRHGQTRQGTVVVGIGVMAPEGRDTPAATAGDRESSERVEILTSSFTADGKPGAEWQRQRLQLLLFPAPPGELQYEALARLTLDPGRYEIRIGARHERDDRVGSVYTYVDVPDFSADPITLSGIVLQDTTGRMGTPPADFADFPVAQLTTRRQFGLSNAVAAWVRVYRRTAASTPVRIAFRVLDSQGRERALQDDDLIPDAFTKSGSTDVGFRLPLEDLNAGVFILRVEASADGASARRDVPFSVK